MGLRKGGDYESGCPWAPALIGDPELSFLLGKVRAGVLKQNSEVRSRTSNISRRSWLDVSLFHEEGALDASHADACALVALRAVANDLTNAHAAARNDAVPHIMRSPAHGCLHPAAQEPEETGVSPSLRHRDYVISPSEVRLSVNMT